MNLIKLLVFLCCCMPVMLQAQQMPNELRGELLYSTHCIACHTSEVHWRDQKLATDWNSLKVQVKRWQANIGLGWSDDDIIDVAYFLNTDYYKFLNTEPQSISQSKATKPIVRKH